MSGLGDLGYALMELVVALSKRTRAVLAATGLALTPDQWALLDRLARAQGDLTQAALAERLDKDPSVILRQTDALAARGFVVRVRDPGDRRRKLLRLTPEGAQAQVEATRALEQDFAALMQGLPEAQVEALRQQVEALRRRAAGDPDGLEARTAQRPPS